MIGIEMLALLKMVATELIAGSVCRCIAQVKESF